MKVLIADKFEKSGVEGLKGAGCEVVYEPDLKDDTLAQAIASSGADVLVVRGTKVTAPMLDAGRLSLIVRAGAGYNTIDVAGASQRGIYVSNCPGKNAIAVAELAFGLMLSLDRRIPDNVAELRGGTWNKKEYSKAQGLYGRTLALLGVGSIGQEMIRRAAGFGMNVVIWSRRFDGQDRPMTDVEARELGVEPALRTIAIALAPTPADAAARGDVVSVHVALGPETKHLVNAALLARMKPGATLINTARGEVVDHAALAAAVKDRGVKVGLDVYANEPAAATAPFSDALAALPGVYGTHHIGASTDQAQEAIAAETVRIVRSYKETGRVPNVVNLARRTPATHMLVVRHRDRPGVLAHVFSHLRQANLNVQETENIVFEGAEAAVARINLDGPPAPDLCQTIKSENADVLDLQLVRL
jgi:D-3-phosphoglycerate dehydrogenase